MIEDSIVSIVLGCRLDDPGYESQQMQKIFSSPKCPNWIGSHLTSYSMGTGGCVPGSRMARA